MNCSTTDQLEGKGLSNPLKRYGREPEVSEKTRENNHVSARAVDILKSIFLLGEVRIACVIKVVLNEGVEGRGEEMKY